MTMNKRFPPANALLPTVLQVCLILASGLSRAETRPSLEREPGKVVLEPATLELSATEKIDYELGTLYVPENRADPRSRIIGVGFARFKAAAPADAPPTFHLPGGPGMSFIANLKGFGRHALRFRAVSDVVMVDQRGFSQRGDVLRYGFRTPDEPLDRPGQLARSTAAFVQTSRDAVKAFSGKGIDLRGYTVKECAHDVDDLRKALGYKQISLVGTSFGSWDAYIASAPIWPTDDVGDDFRTAIRCDIPVIFAQGDWDTQTPVENTLDIARSFPSCRVIIAERGGHGVLEPLAQQHPKVFAQFLSFLRTGTMPQLPERVVLPAPRFAVPDLPPPHPKSP